MPGWRVVAKVAGERRSYYVDKAQAPDLPGLVVVLLRNKIDPREDVLEYGEVGGQDAPVFRGKPMR